VEKLEEALAEKEALVASVTSLREKYNVLQKQFEEREALAEKSAELTNRLQEADQLISTQKKTILNNHEVHCHNQQQNLYSAIFLISEASPRTGHQMAEPAAECARSPI